jgi:predicted O-methyltransferase YrrM
MIVERDYQQRGWAVIPSFSPGMHVPSELLEEMERHPEAAGKSSWGTRNMLFALILSMRPKTVLEIGAHIGSAAVVMGSALKANGFGTLFSLEPQDHYHRLLVDFVSKAGVSDHVKPLQMMSTDPRLQAMIGEAADLIFLDADHSYSNALKDIELADSLIADNGMIVLDDVGPTHSGQICSEKRGGVRQALLDHTAGRTDLHVVFFEPPFWLNPCGMALVSKQTPR